MSIHIPFFLGSLYPRGLGHRRENERRKRKRKVASDLGEDVTRARSSEIVGG